MKKVLLLIPLIVASIACSLPSEVVIDETTPTVLAPTSTAQVDPSATLLPTNTPVQEVTAVPTQLVPGR